MGKIPALTAKEIIEKLQKINYFIDRQKGSHIRLKSDDINNQPITIPNHNNRIVGKGLLRKILRDIKISVDDFIEL
jgi:predicted RNA binding protein YcfA (HicA-like mRNA interferase family)